MPPSAVRETREPDSFRPSMRIFNNPSADWERFGETDPYWAVITDEKFRAGKIAVDARREFFQSGEQHLDAVWRRIRESLQLDFSPRRALDFGCGVGRVLIPLARRCPVAVGVNVASSMLREAQRNMSEQGVTAELVAGDDELSRLSGSFDFIHSYIVFQHIPPRRGEAMVARLLDRLGPGGVAALQFTYRTPISSVQRIARWARLKVPLVAPVANVLKGRPPSNPYMQVYEYDTSRILEIVRAAGCKEMRLEFTDHGGVIGIFIYCRKGATGPQS
jgi:2-polyprenyl-3-methyl-5-hydroxy-6-metoxy-1,4-benzoquinol methylase